MLEQHGRELVFDSIADRARRGYAAVAGGVALVLAAVVGFFVALRTGPGPMAFQAMTTLPVLLAIGLFASAYATLRSPTRVIVGAEGLAVLRGAAEMGRWRWDQIAVAADGRLATSNRRTLKLYGSAGKVVVTLTDDVRDFDGMMAEIRRRMSEHPAAERATVARGKHRRTGAFLMIAGVAFFAVAGANAWIEWHQITAKELLRTQGRPAEAVVVSTFTAPDGRTRRIEYKVDAPGAPTENVEVTEALWQDLEAGQRLPAIAVPGRPDVSRLMAGQVDDSMSGDPKMMLVLSGVMAVMSIVFFMVGVLARRGLEVKWDAERQRPKLVRVEEA
jgi:hypothetical protein